MTAWALAIGAFLSSAQIQTPPLTIEEAVREAMVNAYSLKIAESAIRKADANVREAKSNRDLQIQLNASYSRFDKAVGSGGSVFRPIDSSNASIVASYPLDFGGALGRAIGAARFLWLASKDSFEAGVNDLKLSVRSAYFRVLQAEEEVAVFEEAVKVAEERLRTLRLQFGEGQIARVDVLRGETQLSQAQADRLRSQNALELSRNSLNHAMNRPIETPMTLVAVQPPPIPPVDDSALTDSAIASRNELKALRNQSASFRELVRAAAAARIPTVTLAIQNSYNFGELGFGGTDSSTVGSLSISVNVWDSGRSRAQVDRFREDMRTAALQYDQTVLGISLEVRQATTNWRNAEQRVRVAENQLKTADENLRLAILRADNGEGIQLEVIDAQNARTSAKAQWVLAKYDALLAFAQLQRAVGRDDVVTVSMEGSK